MAGLREWSPCRQEDSTSVLAVDRGVVCRESSLTLLSGQEREERREDRWEGGRLQEERVRQGTLAREGRQVSLTGEKSCPDRSRERREEERERRWRSSSSWQGESRVCLRERREVAAGPAREEGEKSRRETRLYLQEMAFVEEKEQERFGSSDVSGAYLAH